MTAVVAVATCCGSVVAATLRGGSLVAAAMLPVTLGALDERRLVGTDASVLSTLAGARGEDGRHHPANTKTKILGSDPSKTGASGGAATYLKVEKSRFLFLEGSADAVAAPVAATVALPDASAARAGASMARAAPSMDRPVASASPPATGACSSATPAAIGDGGGGTHLSGGARPPSLSSSSSDDDEFSGVPGGESPYCSRSQYSSLRCSRRSRRRIFLSFLCAAHSCSRHCAARTAARARGMGGSDRAASNVTLC
jgi:hypothetical protein